jgi:hypothetical protein
MIPVCLDEDKAERKNAKTQKRKMGVKGGGGWGILEA